MASAVYAKGGARALRRGLNDQGVKNIQNVNHSLEVGTLLVPQGWGHGRRVLALA